MEDPEGSLCAICKSSFHIFNERGTSNKIAHHRKYSDLVMSKDVGCFICTWIWSRHPPPRDEGGVTGDPDEQFTIICEIICNESFWQGYECRITFNISCSWAVNYILTVRLSTRKEQRDKYHDMMARPWAKLDPYIGSPQSLESVQSWISSCEKSHEDLCRSPTEAGAFFPTRILDVQKACCGYVFLRSRDEAMVQRDTGEEDLCCHTPTSTLEHVYPAYWTLSHRWGDPSKINQLCKETEHQLRAGIPLDELSPTFRDATLFVHRLGYRYLWIDSLCIFQDSEVDWQREADIMADVYRNSFCNISAISPSIDPSLGGLFRQRMDNARFLYPFKTNIGIRVRSPSELDYGPWIAWNDSIWIDEIESAALHTRGWVVQERFLSTRIIHFTRNQIYWECLGCTHCEADIMIGLVNSRKVKDEDYIQRKRGYGYKASRREIIKEKANLQARRGRTELYSGGGISPFFWLTILSTYMTCNLTKDSDKLIAMSGIVKAFRVATGDTYLAGLWKQSLHYGLLWKSTANRGTRIRRNESYAPSWSWASVAAVGTGSGVELCDIYRKEVKPLIQVTDERIVAEPPGGDTTGLLRSAELDIKCKLSYFRYRNDSWWPGRLYVDEYMTDCYGRFEFEYTFFDMSDQVEKFAEAGVIEGTCMPICKVEIGRTLYALMLEHVEGKKFRRVGILQCYCGDHDTRDFSDEWKAWWIDGAMNDLTGVITLV
ncbi:HET-domain-containing protein [Daldinia vernicosa]|uniref:HET-domain-containing protein n=1 Tax=Daldinia vernicosa TaxID=114800 RepID=UPI00200837D3|nr:HET-domain-containing protein [Daldinia vernicosa]KAI0843895.1 HET-domain-containing protein [Daldinia vernicosa]